MAGMLDFTGRVRFVPDTIRELCSIRVYRLYHVPENEPPVPKRNLDELIQYESFGIHEKP